MSSNNQKLLRIALVIFGAYTALLLVNLPSFFYYMLQSPPPVDWWGQTIRLVWGMYVWVLIAPIVLLVGFHFQLARPALLRNVFIHLLVGTLAGVIRMMIYFLGLWIFGVITFDAAQIELFKPLTYIQAITGAIVSYPTIVAIQQAYLYFRESQERAYRLQQAELQMLKMQLHPHFFFNTLNAISTLIHTAPEKADKMIVQLGEIFRIALKKDKRQKVLLGEELDLLKSFLQIHQTLMGNRLQIEWDIDAETLTASVPNLILQPLVENSIQHGIAPLADGGRIMIASRKFDEKLSLQIYDNGAGLKNNGRSEGIGISNTRARLKNLYHDAYKFSIEEIPSGGICVKIEIPYRKISAVTA